MSDIIRAKNYERGKQIVKGAPQLYVDVDVEADGVAGYGSLLSIGAVSPWGETFYRELKPTSTLWVPSMQEFCEEHNLRRQRLLDEGSKPAEAISELRDWDADLRAKHRKNGSVLVAFNASFDYPLIDLEFKRADIKDPFGVAGYCIKSLALALDPKNYNWHKTAKSRLPRDVVPEGDFTHHALEDAIYQQKLHYAMVGKLAWRSTKVANKRNPHIEQNYWRKVPGTHTTIQDPETGRTLHTEQRTHPETGERYELRESMDDWSINLEWLPIENDDF